MRVGALLGVDGELKVIQFLGYGKYVGDQVPDEGAVGGLAELARAMLKENPKIELDSGQVVWGCECWWSPEDEMKKTILEYGKQGYVVETVDIEVTREAVRQLNSRIESAEKN